MKLTSQDYTWYEINEIPGVSSALLFAKRAYAEAFSIIIAERRQVYMDTYNEEVKLPTKCEERFFPNTAPRAKQR